MPAMNNGVANFGQSSCAEVTTCPPLDREPDRKSHRICMSWIHKLATATFQY